jgi:putative colanic acid biosynthesis UDP-glucose lipid carrier transferase
MLDTPPLRLQWFKRRTSALLGNGSIQNKAVRFGTLEPAHITLVKRSGLPLLAVLVLALLMEISGRPWPREFYALGLVAFLVAAQILSPLDLRNLDDSKRLWKANTRILLEWSCVVAILVFLAMTFKLTHMFSGKIVLTWFVATPFAMLAAEALSIRIAKWLAIDQTMIQRFIIIGKNELGLELARRFEQTQSGGRFCGFLDYRSPDRLTGGVEKAVTANSTVEKAVTANCTARDFAEFVRNHSITQVYLALPISTTARIDELVKELRDTTASIYFVPNIFAFDLVQARCVEINGMPAFSICDSPLQGMSAVWKRMFDIGLASLAVLLMWPVLAAIALSIKVSSAGPVIFKQRRYGLNAEEILVYKFRTMTVCEDGTVVSQVTRQDSRVTPLGAFLRRTSLDELPQIFNVLEGKMSFVGPRPHAVAHNEEYRKLISGYMIRHKVRPGITGWAQVNGLRGETSTVEKMRERVQYDLDYLKNWSLKLDLQIIARTVPLLGLDRNAY